jgi:hypothetical protein
MFWRLPYALANNCFGRAVCPAVANLPRADQETNGDGNPLEAAYLLAPAEEVENAEKHPLNAELLTMLLLTVCFGVSVGWLLRNAQRQGGLCSLAVVCPSFVRRLPRLVRSYPS